MYREGACTMHVLRASIGVRYQISLRVQYQVKHRPFASDGCQPARARGLDGSGTIAPPSTSPLLYQYEQHNFQAEGCDLGRI